MDPTPWRSCLSLPWVLLSTRGAQNCWQLSWRAWNALEHLQHPTCVHEEAPVGLLSVLCAMGKCCGVVLVTPTRRVAPTQHPKAPPGSALCQVLPAHLLKDHFCSKKLQLEVLTLLQRWEMEAQGFLQIRNYNQISPTSDLSVPQRPLNHSHSQPHSSFWFPWHKNSRILPVFSAHPAAGSILNSQHQHPLTR